MSQTLSPSIARCLAWGALRARFAGVVRVPAVCSRRQSPLGKLGPMFSSSWNTPIPEVVACIARAQPISLRRWRKRLWRRVLISSRVNWPATLRCGLRPRSRYG